MPPGTSVERLVNSFAAELNEFLSNSSAFPLQSFILFQQALSEPRQWTIPALKSLLPLSASLNAWRSRRLPPPSRSDTSPISGHLLFPQIDIFFLMLHTMHGGILSEPECCTLLLDAQPGGWAPGERLRLLAPLSAFNDYACHSEGLSSHYGVMEGLASTAGLHTQGASSMGVTILSGLAYARDVVRAIQSRSGNRELEAVARTIFVPERAKMAANKALEQVVHPGELAKMELPIMITMFNTHCNIVIAEGGVATGVHCDAFPFYLKLLSAAAEKLAAAGLADMQAIGAEMTPRIWALVLMAMPAAGAVPPRMLAALDAAARAAGSWAATPGIRESDRRLALGTCFFMHAARLRWHGLDALDDTSAAFLAVLAQPCDFLGTELTVGARRNVLMEVQAYVWAVEEALGGDGIRDGGKTKLPAPKAGDAEAYLRYLRAGTGVASALLYLPQQHACRAPASLVALITAQRRARPADADFSGFSDAQLYEAIALARAFAGAVCRAGLDAQAGGPVAGLMRHRISQDSGIGAAVFCVQMFIRQFIDVCALDQAAEGRAEVGGRYPPRHAAAALALKGMQFMESLDVAMNGVLRAYPKRSPEAAMVQVPPETLRLLCRHLTAVEDLLAPALTVEDGPVLRWLYSGCVAARGDHTATEGMKQAVSASAEEGPAERAALADIEADMAKMTLAAAVVDSEDVEAAKARAKLLGAGAGCAFLGCSKPELPPVDGGPARKNLKCSGCHCVRYCSAPCQKADWKAHRRACRAIQAERGG